MTQPLYFRTGVAAGVARCDHPAVARGVARVLRYFGFEPEDPPPAGAADLELRITTRGQSPAIPAGAHRRLRLGTSVEVWRGPAGPLFVRGPSGSTSRVDPVRQCADAVVVNPARWVDGPLAEEEILLVLASLLLLLRHRGLYPLHGAAVAAGDDGCLLVGPGGCGKSTLTLGLLEHGFAHLSDDSLLLHVPPAPLRGDALSTGVEALPLRPGLYFHPDRLPLPAARWRPCPLSATAKLRLDLEPERRARRCRPAVLLFPRIVSDPRSELIIIDKAEALLRLLHQSQLVTLEPELAPRHLEMLKRLLDQARFRELRAGRDLRDRPGRLARMLSPWLDARD